jgi:hypothetical protein
VTRQQSAMVQSVYAPAIREINDLELRIVEAEDDTDARLWKQAKKVVEQLNAGMSQRELAAQWMNLRTGEPYSAMHVNYTAKAYSVKFTLQPRPRFRDAYNEIANARKAEPEPSADNSEPAPRAETTPELNVRSDSQAPSVEQSAGKLDIHFSSETVEHYTPDVIIQATLEVFEGVIDLDPCSNSIGEPRIPATSHYIESESGLLKPWAGKVYMNPPYGREIGTWVEKLCLEHAHGGVTEAIALVPARTDTEWFRQISAIPNVCCFVHGRLTFVGNSDPAPFPSAVIYMGEHGGTFYRVFREIGDVWQQLHPELIGEE